LDVDDFGSKVIKLEERWKSRNLYNDSGIFAKFSWKFDLEFLYLLHSKPILRLFLQLLNQKLTEA